MSVTKYLANWYCFLQVFNYLGIRKKTLAALHLEALYSFFTFFFSSVKAYISNLSCVTLSKRWYKKTKLKYFFKSENKFLHKNWCFPIKFVKSTETYPPKPTYFWRKKIKWWVCLFLSMLTGGPNSKGPKPARLPYMQL